MKLEITTDYLDPIELGEYEHVSVRLPDGRQVTVFSDMIYVATGDDVRGHKDGLKIWKASTATYGKICGPAMPKLAHERFLVTRAFGTSGPYRDEEGVRRDADQWNRYLIYRRWVIRFPVKLKEVKGDWSESDKDAA